MREENVEHSNDYAESISLDRTNVYKVNLNLADKNDVRVIAHSYIEESSIVLDVGCACGDFGKLLSSKLCNVYGMEYDAGSIAVASSTKAYKYIHQVDLNNFNENEYEQYLNYFDLITLLDVLEHLVKPEQALKSLIKLLKPDGFFIISLPNISFCDIKADLLINNFTYTDTGIMDATHLKFYTHKSIAEMMARLGLEIYKCQPKVALFSENKAKIPYLVKRYILRDPHSFVYQYVLKVKPSSKTQEGLNKRNSDMVNLDWSSISVELNKLKKRRWLQVLFPRNSLQYKMAKKFKDRKKGV